MGFFSGIGSFCSSIASGISSVCSSICSGIGSAISKVGSVVSSFAKTAITALGKAVGFKAGGLLGMAAKIMAGPLGPIICPVIVNLAIKVIAKVTIAIAKKLGIIGEKEKPEEVGYRIDEANKPEHQDWRQPEEFPSFKEYYAYLKQQIPDEKIDQHELETNKRKYTVLGTAAIVKGLEESYRINLPESFMMEIGRSRMNSAEVQAVIEVFKTLGYDRVIFSDYLRGSLQPSETRRIAQSLTEAMLKYCPQKSRLDVLRRLDTMKINSVNDERMAENSYRKELEDLKTNQEKAACLRDDYNV